ncbi:MAG: stage V sporulation T C-terminal domain-containing protein [Bacillota bacterium]|nr:stage V sporulation T C-terminal domain-containing protein [Bacillota bacterium]
MKATGIVRRIDDLGRVVIPKEIRRTMRIREGEPLEIYTDRDGEVIFKKYSPIGELGNIAMQYADALNKTTGMSVAISDRDAVIAASGNLKKELQDKRISSELERMMDSRQTYLYKSGSMHPLTIIEENTNTTASVAVPIISEGDVIGSVCIVLTDKNTPPSDAEIKLAQTGAVYLGKQLET